MKSLIKNKYVLYLAFIIIADQALPAAAQEDSVAAQELVKMKYYSENNSLQYLLVENILKKGKQTEPLKNKTIRIYMDSVSNENLVGNVVTGKDGKAKSFLPPSLKIMWDASGQHKFIAVAAGKEDETAAELEITKSKIEIDTASEEGKKTITVRVLKNENGDWTPAADVEMKVGIQRLGGILSAGAEETYTTDSSGSVAVEVTRDSLPGNEKGNIFLSVKVEDNDLLGNLLVKKEVPWGVATQPQKNFFNQRTLWSTRFKTPFWLLFLAYSIVLSVWGTLIYIVVQLIKIKKLGNSNPGGQDAL